MSKKSINPTVDETGKRKLERYGILSANNDGVFNFLQLLLGIYFVPLNFLKPILYSSTCLLYCLLHV